MAEGSPQGYRASLQAAGRARKAREHIFNEWEHTQFNIRELSKALGCKTNEMLKREMEADIVALINRKN